MAAESDFTMPTAEITVDWLNAVVVAATKTMTVGLYAGIVASRVFAFFQVRTKAASWIFRFKEAFDGEHESPRELSMAFSYACQETLMEVRGLGHEKLVTAMQAIMLEHFAHWAQLLRIPIPPHGIPVFPDKEQMRGLLAPRGPEIFGRLLPRNATPEETAGHVWRHLLAAARDYYGNRISCDTANLTKTKPDIWTLLTLNPFPDYVSANGSNIGLLVRRPSGWTILRSRIARHFRK